jgi:hypothetical protein
LNAIAPAPGPHASSGQTEHRNAVGQKSLVKRMHFDSLRRFKKSAVTRVAVADSQENASIAFEGASTTHFQIETED